MANISVEPGVGPAPKSLPARFIGVLTEPRATFASVAANPKWLGMLVLTTLLIAFFAALPMTTESGKAAALDQQVRQMRSMGFDVNEQMYASLERQAAIAPYITAGSIIVMGPIMAVIVCGILFAVFNAAMGGNATFKQLFSVYVHAGVVSAVGQLFTGPLNYFRGETTGATNLGVLLPMLDEGSFVSKLAGMLDLFAIWWVVVLAIGLGVLYRRKTQPIAIAFFSIYAVVALGVAAFMSRGGTN